MNNNDEKKDEQYLAVCKICQEEKLRKPDGVFGNGKDRRWIDENQKIWNGRRCGDCQAKKMRNHQQVKRKKSLQ